MATTCSEDDVKDCLLSSMDHFLPQTTKQGAESTSSAYRTIHFLKICLIPNYPKFAHHANRSMRRKNTFTNQDWDCWSILTVFYFIFFLIGDGGRGEKKKREIYSSCHSPNPNDLLHLLKELISSLIIQGLQEDSADVDLSKHTAPSPPTISNPEKMLEYYRKERVQHMACLPSPSQIFFTPVNWIHLMRSH